jgi:hypothetical protein
MDRILDMRSTLPQQAQHLIRAQNRHHAETGRSPMQCRLLYEKTEWKHSVPAKVGVLDRHLCRPDHLFRPVPPPCWRSLMQDQKPRSTLIFTRNRRMAIDSCYFIFASHSAEKESLLNQGDSQAVPKWTFRDEKK